MSRTKAIVEGKKVDAEHLEEKAAELRDRENRVRITPPQPLEPYLAAGGKTCHGLQWRPDTRSVYGLLTVPHAPNRQIWYQLPFSVARGLTEADWQKYAVDDARPPGTGEPTP